MYKRKKMMGGYGMKKKTYGGAKKRKLYSNAGIKEGKSREEVQNTPGGVGGGVVKKTSNKSSSPAVNTNNFKAGKSREEVQNTPGGTGGGVVKKTSSKSNSSAGKNNSKAGSPAGSTSRGGVVKKKSEESKPKASNSSTAKPKTTSGKRTYAEAKKKDPKLDSYIRMRKQAAKGSNEYNRLQNLINAAYGVQKRYAVKEEKMETQKPSTVTTKPSASSSKASKTSSTKSTTSSTKAPTKMTTSGGSGMGSVNQKQMSDFIEEDKSISFDSPSKSKKEQRKEDRKAVKSFRKSMRDARKGRVKKGTGGLKDVPSDNKGLPNLPKSVRNKMGYKKNGGKKGKMKDRRR